MRVSSTAIDVKVMLRSGVGVGARRVSSTAMAVSVMFRSGVEVALG